jgi:hypothetical protein
LCQAPWQPQIGRSSMPSSDGNVFRSKHPFKLTVEMCVTSIHVHAPAMSSIPCRPVSRGVPAFIASHRSLRALYSKLITSAGHTKVLSRRAQALSRMQML